MKRPKNLVFGVIFILCYFLNTFLIQNITKNVEHLQKINLRKKLISNKNPFNPVDPKIKSN